MRKYFLTLSTIALFAIGFAASDEESSSSSPSSSSSSGTQQVEQKKETEAERQAREKREKQEQFERMMKDAYDYGVSQGKTFTYYQECDGYFTKRWFTPSTDEEFEIFRKYKEEYNRGFDEGHRIKEKMRNM